MKDHSRVHARPLGQPARVKAAAATERRTVLRSIVAAAKAGMRFVSYVALPIGYVMVVYAFGLTAFGLGAGRGLGLYSWHFAGVGFFLSCELWGAIIGGVVGLFVGLISKLRGQAGSAGWWGRLNRPIRLGSSRDEPEPDRLEFLEEDEEEPRHFRREPPRRSWVRVASWYACVGAYFIWLACYFAGNAAGYYVNRRLSRAIAATNRDDPAWRLDDLMAAREKVPDDENSAIVVAKAFKLLPKNWPEAPTGNYSFPKPPPTEASRALDQLRETPPYVRPDAWTAAVLRAELAQHNEAVLLARSVADYRRGRHELKLAKMLFETSLAESQNARRVANLLEMDAAVRAEDGDIDGALDSCRAILGVARSIGDEPFLISGLVRVAIGSSGLVSARRVLAQGEPSDAAMAEFQEEILEEMAQPLMLVEIKGERATLDEVIRRIADAEVPIESMEGLGRFDDPVPPVAPWLKLSFDCQRAVTLELMQGLVDIARRPPHERSGPWNSWKAEFEWARRAPLANYTSKFATLMLPAMDRAESGLNRYQAQLGATAILLASERHRRKVGAWPASIDAIDPEFLGTAPPDPYTGDPFLLELADGEFRIHSIGPNLEDEAGAYEPRHWDKQVLDDVGGAAWDVDQRRQPAFD